MGAESETTADLKSAYVKGTPNDSLVTTTDYKDSPHHEHNVKTINYQTTSWQSTAVLLTKAQIGLGVLSLPEALNVLGAFYGLLAIVVLGIFTTYGNYIVGRFIMRHPDVRTPADAGQLMYGKVIGEFIGTCSWLLYVCVVGSSFLAASTGLNTFSDTNTCTVVWVVVAALVAALFAVMPKIQYIAWVGWLGLPCILVSIIILMGVVGSAGRPPLAPEGPYDRQLAAFGTPSVVNAFVALVNILFSYAGTPFYFSIISEMTDKRKFTKAMLLSQTFCILFYVVVSTVVWRYCGQYIASPALGSAGAFYQIVCYGVAFPGLEAGAIIFLHISAKYIFVRIYKNTKHLTQQSVLHWVGWISCIAFCAIFGFVIAQAIPFFSILLGLLGALFCSGFCLILPALMWHYDHRHKERNTTWNLLAVVNVVMLTLGLFLLGAGTWACAESIKESYSSGDVGEPFSCADNS